MSEREADRDALVESMRASLQTLLDALGRVETTITLTDCEIGIGGGAWKRTRLAVRALLGKPWRTRVVVRITVAQAEELRAALDRSLGAARESAGGEG